MTVKIKRSGERFVLPDEDDEIDLPDQKVGSDQPANEVAGEVAPRRGSNYDMYPNAKDK